jgi:hypothetical protein
MPTGARDYASEAASRSGDVHRPLESGALSKKPSTYVGT